MRTRLRPPRLLAAAMIGALGATTLALAMSDHDASSSAEATVRARPDRTVLATVEVRHTVAVPRSFLGLSTEYEAVPIWEGHGRVVARVLRLLRPSEGGRLLLRVGGDTADRSFWDPAGSPMPSWAIALTPAWLRATGELTSRSGARLMLDLNLVTGSPDGAARWASAAEQGLPSGAIAGYEIGNEPDIYSRRAWLANAFTSRRDAPRLPEQITSADYDRDFAAYARALAPIAPGAPLAGPVLAHPADDAGWVRSLLAHPHPGLHTVTGHIYPLSACAQPGTRRYPTLARVLSSRLAASRARALEPAVRSAHRAGLAFRVTELNSVTCGGLAGVSNSFATALWAPQALFDLIRVGVDGVNIHVHTGTINAAFAVDGHGRLSARPLLYGLILFERTLGPDARLARIALHGASAPALEAWAVRVGTHGLHVLLINSGRSSARVALAVPGAGKATVARLIAPAMSATSGVSLDGRRIGSDARWAGRSAEQAIASTSGRYVVAVPRASAALIQLHLAAEGRTHV